MDRLADPVSVDDKSESALFSRAIGYDDIFAQSHVSRYHMVRTMRPQNNAEHHYRVALLSLKLYHELLYWRAQIGYNDAVDPLVEHQLLLHGLTHDMAEWELGDPPAPTKRVAAVKQAFSDLESNFWRHRGVAERWTELVTHLVKIADLAEGYIFSFYNQGLGHRNPDQRWKFVVEGLEQALKAYVDKLPHPAFPFEFRARLLHLIFDQKLGLADQHA